MRAEKELSGINNLEMESYCFMWCVGFECLDVSCDDVCGAHVSCAHASCGMQDAKAKGAQVISPGAAHNWGHSSVVPSILFPVTKAMRVMQVPTA